MTQPAAPVPGRHPAYGDLPAGVHGLAVRFGLRSLEERHDSRTVLGTYVLINSAISIGILAGIAVLTKQPKHGQALMAPMGQPWPVPAANDPPHAGHSSGNQQSPEQLRFREPLGLLARCDCRPQQRWVDQG